MNRTVLAAVLSAPLFFGLLLSARREDPSTITPDVGARLDAARVSERNPYFCHNEPTPEQETQKSAGVIAESVSVPFFQSCCQSGPLSEILLNPLIPLPPSNVDPWGNEFHVRCTRRFMRVISAGPDRVLDTADDIFSQIQRWDIHRDPACRSTGPFSPAAESASTMDEE